jgi:hypothetical protein
MKADETYHRPADALASAVEEVRNGAKLKDVADRLGVPPRTLCRWTIAAGVRRKTKTQGSFTPESIVFFPVLFVVPVLSVLSLNPDSLFVSIRVHLWLPKCFLLILTAVGLLH